MESDIRRISDHGVKPALREDLRESFAPIEGVYPPPFLRVNRELSGEVVPTDQRVAALDVTPEVGQGALQPQAQLSALLLQHLQQQAQLGHLHRLRVNIHTVQVVQQYLLLLQRGQAVAV